MHLRVNRDGGYSGMLKKGRYDPTTGVTTLRPHHPDDARQLREWIINNFRRLDAQERNQSRYRRLVLEAWDERDPTVLYRNWDWLDGQERRKRRTGYLLWRRVERPTVGDMVRKTVLKIAKRILIG